MKTNNSNIIFIGMMTLFLFGISVIGYIAREGKKQDELQQITKDIQTKKLIISQYEMKEAYGWKEIILWNESKDSFEKAYNTKLNWINYAMGFQRDPMCTDPIGGGGEWQYEKICFNFVLRTDLPNMLDEIAVQTRGKTIVVIGSIHNNNQRFSGNVYWCE